MENTVSDTDLQRLYLVLALYFYAIDHQTTTAQLCSIIDSQGILEIVVWTQFLLPHLVIIQSIHRLIRQSYGIHSDKVYERGTPNLDYWAIRHYLLRGLNMLYGKILRQ